MIVANSYITSTSLTTSAHINDNAGYLTPLRVANSYNIPASTGVNAKVGIISLSGGFLQSDLDKSMDDLGLPRNTVTFVASDSASYNWYNDPYGGNIENTLDLYCVAGIAPQANVVIYSGTNSGAGFASAINRAIAENCDVITISWGTTESSYLADFLEPAFASASAKGITVCVATGDYGSEPIINANIQAIQYPAASSNVVAVGGTHLNYNPSGNIRITETVEYNQSWGGSGGGGGVSTFIPVPKYQTGLTYQQYFKANSTPGPVTTLTHRGIPDIAAAMNPYGFWYNGTIISAGGTSASAPIMAGMFARFIALNGGRRPIPNTIHSILYGNLNSYYDIFTGNNATVQYVNGYAASSNWDPVTGVGVPWGNLVYPMVTSGGTTIKTDTNTWSYIANVQVKTDTNTWSNVKAVWTKTINGWQQTF